MKTSSTKHQLGATTAAEATMLVPSRHQQLSLIKKLEVEPHSTVVNIHAVRKASRHLGEDNQ